MKNLILISILVFTAAAISACGGGGSSGGSEQVAGAQFQPNDPTVPQVSLAKAIIGKWSTDCAKAPANMGGGYQGIVTDIRKNGAMYTYRMMFQDNACTMALGAPTQETKFGTYELIDLADAQPSGDLHFMSGKRFERSVEGEARESVLRITLSGRQAQTMQIITTDMMVKHGALTVEDPKARGKTKIAHRVQGI